MTDVFVAEEDDEGGAKVVRRRWCAADLCGTIRAAIKLLMGSVEADGVKAQTGLAFASTDKELV